jgi:MoaA/NifB/PqqE/SkfB family radical SAM enzyme
MRRLPFTESVRVIGRSMGNWFAERPLVVSFEVTDSCTCNCRHCDHGGPRDRTGEMRPGDFRRYIKILRPAVVQISGGEPLLREDITEVIENIKEPSGLPYTILVSNWSLMTEDKYLALRNAGVNQFSVSLDFPDERHDEFRGYPGLFAKIDELMPRLAAYGYDDIVLNTCITKENLPYVNDCADRAKEWGVNMSYSAYSARRTGESGLLPDDAEDLNLLRDELERVKSRMDSSRWIVNNETTIDATYEYFVNGGTPNCTAGKRFLVVTADGCLQPCSMQFHKYDVTEQKRMIEEFTDHNECGECYVAIRSYLDKGFWQLLFESVGGHFGFKPRKAYDNRPMDKPFDS